jgi:tetratricopeptide (TPR) repeat protein
MWRLWLGAGPPEVRDGIRESRELLDAGQVREAQIALNRVIARWPDAAEPYNQRARIFMIQHDYASAIEDCRRAVERLPHHFDAVARMGECYLRLGRLDDAVLHYREALRINPNLQSVWKRLAQIRNLPMSATDESLSRT